MLFSEQFITTVILVTLIGSYLLNNVADFLNLANLNQPIPEEFKNYYDKEKYNKSQDYLITNTKFGFITSSFDLIIILGFWFSGGFQFIDSFVRSFNYGSIVTGLLFTGLLVILNFVISLPFSIYSTFVIEEKFGFNKTTPLVFATDIIKSITLGTILGGILLSTVFWFFEFGG
ncbi:M48 family peptidase, partial [bacterium]|nr:M48 family peptidase [bacterium]